MTEVAFLAYVPDPFAVQSSSYMVLEPPDNFSIMSARELSGYQGLLLTYDVPSLVDDLRRWGHSPPRGVLDIGDALRLAVGRSKDDGGEPLWSAWPALKRHFAVKADAEDFELVSVARTARPDQDELSRLLREALVAIQLLWNELRTQLAKVGELGRLTAIEWPLQSAFARRQFLGIRVDARVAETLLERISAERYAAYRRVAELLNKSPTGLNFWNIHPQLERTDVAHLAEIEPGGRLQDAFELAAPGSEFARAFLTLIKSSRDANVVRRSLGGEGRLFPIFHVMGTISGRILVSDPYLQQLRRAYRSLIVADPNTRLIYLDFSQFEPGVLAGLCKDEKFIAAYNHGDLYSELAEALLGNRAERPVAKRVFLAFSYGMTIDRIALLLAGPQSTLQQRLDFADKIDAFFKAFPGLADYRITQQRQLVDEGFVSSLFGNRRVRMSKGGSLSPKEMRWAVNQPIQATASLVFKEALIGLVGEFGIDSIVLPVHDAVVLQFRDDDRFDENVARAEAIMVQAFGRRIPKIHARITRGTFAD